MGESQYVAGCRRDRRSRRRWHPGTSADRFVATKPGSLDDLAWQLAHALTLTGEGRLTSSPAGVFGCRTYPIGRSLRRARASDLPILPFDGAACWGPDPSLTLGYDHAFPLPNCDSILPHVAVHYETSSWLSYYNETAPVDGVSGWDQQKTYTRTDSSAGSQTPATIRTSRTAPSANAARAA
jgi:hypothetical protein